jgi:F-type H+-transporting ATPase subunit epsilon
VFICGSIRFGFLHFELPQEVLYMADADKKNIRLVVLTVDRKVYEGEVDSVTGLGAGGEFTVLPSHIAFMTPLEVGVLTARSNGREEGIALHAGFLRVEDDTVTVLADAAERARDIDVERAKAAKLKAEELLKRIGEGRGALESAGAAMRRALLRLRVAGRD